MSSLESIPVEIAMSIFDFLPPQTHFALGLVSRKIHAILAPRLEQHALKHPKFRVLDLEGIGGKEHQKNLVWGLLEFYAWEDTRSDIIQYLEEMILVHRQSTFVDNGFYGLKPEFSLTVRAPLYYGMMKDDFLLHANTESSYRDRLTEDLQTQLEMVDKSNGMERFLKTMIFDGEDSPIIAKLLIMAVNLRSLAIAFTGSHDALARLFARTATAYVLLYHGTLSTPFLPSWLPFQHLTTVLIYSGNHGAFVELCYFALIPTVKYILGDVISYHSTEVSGWLHHNLGLGRRLSDVERMILTGCLLSGPDLRQLLGNIIALKSLVAEVSLFQSRHIIEALLEYQYPSLEHLWLDIERRHTFDDEPEVPAIANQPAHFEITVQMHSPLQLRWLHCEWDMIVMAATANIGLLVDSLEVLLLLHVPASSVHRVKDWLDLLPRLKEFSATLNSAEPIGDSDPISTLKQEVERRGIRWLNSQECEGLRNQLMIP